MAMGKLRTEEHQAITLARAANPTMGQRTLAKKMYFDTKDTGIGYATRFRSRATIYGALRRHDSTRKAIIEKAIVGAEKRADAAEQSHNTALAGV